MIENKLQGGYATDMDEYAKSIIPIIEANYEKYTETERYIADYFLKQARPERLSAELVSKELSYFFKNFIHQSLTVSSDEVLPAHILKNFWDIFCFKIFCNIAVIKNI
jgi:hypothetical protein